MVEHPMDETEAIVDRYLRVQDYQDVVYEPDGNVPPDFLVDGTIAIEVRLLNKHKETGDGPRGLENVEAAAVAVVREVLDSLGSSQIGPSWFVVFGFSRPLPPWKKLKLALASMLADFDEPPGNMSARMEIVPRFHVQLFRALKQMPNRFTLNGYIDQDRIGSIRADMLRNLVICVEDKSHKVERVLNRYSQWWLVLVDSISGGLDEADQAWLQARFTVETPWERVIVVDPANPEQAFSL